MGRKRIEIEPEKIMALSSRGLTQVEMAKELGISHVTLARRIADLRKKEGVLVDYRSIQALQLTALQARVLESITPEKIKVAPLSELVRAFGILKKMELAMSPLKINLSGLDRYLTQLEEIEKN